MLVALETLILFADVVSRYVCNAPLTWSDELAAILFLWLAMLGAVISLRLVPMLVDTASLSGAILLIIGCATAMAWALTPSGFLKALVEVSIHPLPKAERLR